VNCFTLGKVFQDILSKFSSGLYESSPITLYQGRYSSRITNLVVARLTPHFLLRLGFSPRAKVLDLKERVRCRGAEREDRPSFRSIGRRR
jgi:hypothetical protein